MASSAVTSGSRALVTVIIEECNYTFPPIEAEVEQPETPTESSTIRGRWTVSTTSPATTYPPPPFLQPFPPLILEGEGEGTLGAPSYSAGGVGAPLAAWTVNSLTALEGEGQQDAVRPLTGEPLDSIQLRSAEGAAAASRSEGRWSLPHGDRRGLPPLPSCSPPSNPQEARRLLDR